MSSDPKNHGLVARGAPVKPPLFKMPQRMTQCESDRANGGGITVTGRTQMDVGHGYYQQKHKVEKFDSGLDEITQYRFAGDLTAITPVSCTEDDGGHYSEYVFQPCMKQNEPNSKAKPKIETHTDISDSAIELSQSSVSYKKTKIEESEIRPFSKGDSESKIDSKILRTVHYLFDEDEDGER